MENLCAEKKVAMDMDKANKVPLIAMMSCKLTQEKTRVNKRTSGTLTMSKKKVDLQKD